MQYSHFLVLVVTCLWIACSPRTASDLNPAADGFMATASDAKAIQIADQVMMAMGGRKAWDDTRIIAWNFLGKRHLIWNKHSGDVRITSPVDSTIYLVNIFDGTGRVKVGESVVTDPEQKNDLLKKAKRYWINDSYWLVMPFKLKDSGVTLKYLREGKTEIGAPAHVLELTFDNVGVTPNNRYEIWVDQSDHLVKQWAFYRERHLKEPRYVRPWDHYREYNKILLSADRSDKYGPSHVVVLDELDTSVFNDWRTPELVQFK